MNIASVDIRLRAEAPIFRESDPPAYLAFKGESDILPHRLGVNVFLTLGGAPNVGEMPLVYDTSGSWRARREENTYVLSLGDRDWPMPFWLAISRDDLASWTVYCSQMLCVREGMRTGIRNPFSYPLDQVLLMHFLTRHLGVIVHCAGLEINGQSFIFPGRSGAGKSTISRLLLPCQDLELLSDDRMIVRKMGDALHAFGTPWPGDAGIAVNKGAPLGGIFFLKHALKTKIREISPMEGTNRLMPVVSIPWYDEVSVQGGLTVCDELVSRVPCYELAFEKKPEVADVLMDFFRG